MAKAHFLQPARASLVEEWIGYIRQEFPEKAKDVNLAAFADGHINGYSVTSEIFADMAAAKQIAYTAWDQVFALGAAPVEIVQDACREIEAVQQRNR